MTKVIVSVLLDNLYCILKDNDLFDMMQRIGTAGD